MMGLLTAFSFLVLGSMVAPAHMFPFILTQLSTRKTSCKAIPSSMNLCHGVGYNEMRLPNLLGHDTLKEATQQAGSWVPLLSKQCHKDTKKFLCSLFAPVCISELDVPVFPCRMLCEEVRDGCMPVMAAFGFPWPDMFNCSQFPPGNELCIPTADSEDQMSVARNDNPCAACINRGENEKEFLENFCAKDFALKMTIRVVSSLDGDLMVIPEVRSRTLYRHEGWTEEELKKTVLWLTDGDTCSCEEMKEPGAIVLALGHKVDNRLVISWVRKWQKGEKDLKKFTRVVRKMHC
ncbi:secreted frizzled-related protein 2-like [Pleurodeles waltl]